MNSHFAFSLGASVIGFFVILAWRVRETQTPVTFRKIIAPPLGMSTGFCMFVVPAFRVPWSWGLVAVALGATLLAYPLLRTTKLHTDASTGRVMVKRSPAFFLVFIGLALIRLLAKEWINRYISIPQTGAIFYLLAFGMIVHWRIGMIRDFRRLQLAPVPAS